MICEIQSCLELEHRTRDVLSLCEQEARRIELQILREHTTTQMQATQTAATKMESTRVSMKCVSRSKDCLQETTT